MKYGFWLIIAGIIGVMFWKINAESVVEPEVSTEVSVQTASIVKMNFRRFIFGYGLVEPEPAASAKIAVPLAGIVSQIHCREGQLVKKGDLLFELDTRSSDALIAKAGVAVAFAEKNFARKQQLNASDNVSRKLYDEAEQLLQAARKDLLSVQTQRELLQIKAPLSGTVAAIHFKVGEAVNLNTVLADLIDLRRLHIAVKVPSVEVTDIRLGQFVAITAGSGANITGSVTLIGAQIDQLTDTILVRASVAAESGLRPGQFVSVGILVEERPDRLAVPVASVVNKEGSSLIAVVDGDSAVQQTIKTGLRDGGFIEVAGAGLVEGTVVVTQGAYGLPSKTRVKVAQ